MLLAFTGTSIVAVVVVVVEDVVVVVAVVASHGDPVKSVDIKGCG